MSIEFIFFFFGAWSDSKCIHFLNMQVFGDEADMYKLEDVQMNDFGTVKEVTVTKDDTLMMKASLLSLSLIKSCLPFMTFDFLKFLISFSLKFVYN